MGSAQSVFIPFIGQPKQVIDRKVVDYYFNASGLTVKSNEHMSHTYQLFSGSQS